MKIHYDGWYEMLRTHYEKTKKNIYKWYEQSFLMNT